MAPSREAQPSGDPGRENGVGPRGAVAEAQRIGLLHVVLPGDLGPNILR